MGLTFFSHGSTLFLFFYGSSTRRFTASLVLFWSDLPERRFWPNNHQLKGVSPCPAL
jgi:hypothetical protein